MLHIVAVYSSVTLIYRDTSPDLPEGTYPLSPMRKEVRENVVCYLYQAIGLTTLFTMSASDFTMEDQFWIRSLNRFSPALSAPSRNL